MLLEIKINLMSPSILFLFIPIAYSMLNTELNTFSFGDLRRTGYPSVGTVSYPVPTRTQSDKMYPVHHFPPLDKVLRTAEYEDIPPSTPPETDDRCLILAIIQLNNHAIIGCFSELNSSP